MKFKIKKFLLVSVLIGMILFSMCPQVFATNGNEMSISSKEGIGNTLEIVSGNTTNIKSESVADVVSYLSGQGITVNSITNHKGATVELTSTVLIGTGYVLNTSDGDYSVIVYGDANGDGEVDAGDMKVVIDDFLGIKQASPIAKIALDVYQDGTLDAADLKLTLDSFLGNLKGSILNNTNTPTPTPTSMPTLTPTPTPDISVTPTPVPTSTSSGPQIMVDGQTVTLTKSNAPEYYGKVVTNYDSPTPVTWKLFYIDFDGKYGEAGKIYLKAEQVTTTALSVSSSISSTKAVDKMKQMNPSWARYDGVVYLNNEHAVLWLCEEDNWSSYKNNEKADYVMGAPSVEMYIDSYNAYHSKKGTAGYQIVKYACTTSDIIGYKYSIGTSGKYVYYICAC